MPSVVLRLDGSATSLIQHNERLADPIDPFARSLAEISGKRNRTEAEHLEMGKREFLGGLYTEGDKDAGRPVIPAWNILRCLQEGAKRHKRSADVLRGVAPLHPSTPLLYDGPLDPEDLWSQREKFSLRKGVGVAGRKVMRTRPIFHSWQAELCVLVDANIFDLDTLAACWTDAGRFAGLGDMRPIYGRFEASLTPLDKWLKQVNGATDTVWANNKATFLRIAQEDIDRKKRHAA